MKKRNADLLCGLAIWLAIFYGLLYPYSSTAWDLNFVPFSWFQYQDLLLFFGKPWVMMLLFTAAGMSLRCRVESLGYKRLFRDTARRLLVPATLGFALLYWVQGWLRLQIQVKSGSGLLALWAACGDTLGYVLLMWLCILLLLPLSRLDRLQWRSKLLDRIGLPGALLLAVPLWAILRLLGEVPGYRAALFATAFFFGFFFLSREAVQRRLAPWHPFLLGLSLGLGLGYVIYYFGEPHLFEPILSGPYTIFYGWTMVLTFATARFSSPLWDRPWASYLQTRSYGVYLLSVIPLYGCLLVLGTPQRYPALVCYPAIFAASLGGGLILYELISRIPGLRFLLLGMKKPGRHNT